MNRSNPIIDPKQIQVIDEICRCFVANEHSPDFLFVISFFNSMVLNRNTKNPVTVHVIHSDGVLDLSDIVECKQ